MRQIVKRLSILTIAVTLLAGLTTAASAAPVLILNAGFEAQVLGDGGVEFTIDDWVNNADNGVFNPHAAAFALGAAPEGENVAFSSVHGYTIYQELTATAQANTLYTLTMLVGNRLDTPFGGYQTELWAGSTMLAQDNSSLLPADGQFLTSTVLYFMALGDAAVGLPLEIRFRSLGFQTVFDDVRLDATERVPEPALLAMLGLGAAAVARRRRR